MNKKNTYGLYFAPLKNKAMVALVKNTEKTISLKSEVFALNEISESLWTSVREVLTLNGLSKDDISVCYVNNGPSRFNSDRLITLSAKSFAYFQKIDLYYISNLKIHMIHTNHYSILMDAGNNSSYFAFVDEEGVYHEMHLDNKYLDAYLTLSPKEPVRVELMEVEAHQNAFLESLSWFKLAPDASALKTNYVRNPLIKTNEQPKPK